MRQLQSLENINPGVCITLTGGIILLSITGIATDVVDRPRVHEYLKEMHSKVLSSGFKSFLLETVY